VSLRQNLNAINYSSYCRNGALKMLTREEIKRKREILKRLKDEVALIRARERNKNA